MINGAENRPVVHRGIPALTAVDGGRVFGGGSRGHGVPVLGLSSVSVGGSGRPRTFTPCQIHV